MTNGQANGAPANPGERTPSQDEIAQRAYAIWQDAGAPAGRESDHWVQAERELSASLRGTPAAAGTPSTTPYSASGSSSVSGQGATSSGSGLGSGGGQRS
jgi:hypothetical protein